MRNSLPSAKTQRKAKKVAITLAVSAVLLAACGTSSGGQAKSAQSSSAVVHLTFADFSQPTGFGEVTKLIDKWNAAHPKVQVKVEHISVSALPAKYAEEIRGGKGPDIMHVAFVWTQELAKAGLLENLSPLNKKSPLAGLSKYTALKINSYNHSLYALPWNVDTGALTYDQSDLKAAGIQRLPNTWSSLERDAVLIHKKLGSVDGFCFPAGSKPNSDYFYFFNSYMWSNGQYLVKGSGSSTRLGVTAAQLTADFSYFKKLFTSGATPTSMLSINQWGNPTYIHDLASGACAFGQEYPEDFPAVDEAAHGALSTFPAPKGSVTRAWQLGGRSLAISAKTKYPEQSWEVVKYLTSASAMKAMGYYSPNPSEVTITAKAEQGFSQMIKYSHTFEVYTATPINLPAVEAAIDSDGGAVDSGQTSAASAASSLIAVLKGYLS